MRPYSTDFRLKVVRAYEKGEGSQRDLARIFAVSLSFVHGLLQRYRQTGSVEPKPHGGGNPGKVGPYLGIVQHLHQQQPDASLTERCERLAAAAQVRVGRTTMHRVLKQLRLEDARQTSYPTRDSEQSTPYRAQEWGALCLHRQCARRRGAQHLLPSVWTAPHWSGLVCPERVASDPGGTLQVLRRHLCGGVCRSSRNLGRKTLTRPSQTLHELIWETG